MMSNPKIKDGPVDLVPSNIEPKDETIRISMILEGDLLDALRAKAALLGLPYQTLMKLYLRQALEMLPKQTGALRKVLMSNPATKTKREVKRTGKGKPKSRKAAS